MNPVDAIPTGFGWWFASAGVAVVAYGVARAAVREVQRRVTKWRRRNRHRLDVLPWAAAGFGFIATGVARGIADSAAPASPGALNAAPAFAALAVSIVAAVVWRVVAHAVKTKPDLDHRVERGSRRAQGQGER